MNIRFFPTLFVICGIAGFAWFTGGFFNSTNVCSDCGGFQSVHRVIWIPFKTFQETPLSNYLKSLGRPHPKDHDWLLISGNGGPVRCALGNGGNLMQSARSNSMVDALKLIRTHRGHAEADRWIDRIFDRKTTSDVRLAFYSLVENPGEFETNYAERVEFFEDSQIPSSP